MTDIRVQYDANDRVFKLIDKESHTLLEGDALCDFAFPRIFEDDGELELN